MNLNHDYWVKKFLYPFSLDPTPLRLSDYPMPTNTTTDEKPQEEEATDNILESKKFQYPLSRIEQKQEYVDDIMRPITIQQDEIVKDMYAYSRKFPTKVIPHVTENGDINDIIHNYAKPPKRDLNQTRSFAEEEGEIKLTKQPKLNLALQAAAPPISETMITQAIDEITSESTAKLIGLMCHFCYWQVFGHLNPMPLDKYHLKQLFINISKIKQSIEKKFINEKRMFVNFVMPMIILALRIEMELIFKNTFPIFFSKEVHEKIGMKLLNDVVTKILDSNLFFSRFSFFESGREAINLKFQISKK